MRHQAGPQVGRPRQVTCVVSAYGSFHGRTLATLHATGQPTKHEPFQPLPEGFRHVAWDDLDALEAAIDPSVAAVLLEPVQGEGGVHPASAGVLPGACAGCATSGACCSWSTRSRPGSAAPAGGSASSTSACEPDVVTMAKALGNGVPIGACWARDDVAAAFEPGDHATTFGGQPLAAAAARAVLAVMEAEDVPARAAARGAYLMAALALAAGSAQRPGPRAAGRRRAGPGQWPRRWRRLPSSAGLVVNPVTESALRLAPSLLVTEEEIDKAMVLLATAISEVADSGSGPDPGEMG